MSSAGTIKCSKRVAKAIQELEAALLEDFKEKKGKTSDCSYSILGKGKFIARMSKGQRLIKAEVR